MRIVVVGDGKVGATLTEYLSKEGHDVVVIDNSQKVIESVVNNFDVMGICGNGASYEVQMEAKVNKADLLIAATSADELNILCCLTAKKIGAKNTIARVRNPEYVKQLMLMREELGLSMVVNPEYEAAKEISRMLRSPATIKIDDFSKGRAELAEIKINEDSPLCEKPLSSLYKTYKLKILVCAVQRGESVFIPDGNFVLKPQDKIYITSSYSDLDAFLKSIGLMNKKIKTVMIIGGGKITYYLARQLEEIGISVKIIEQDEQRCVELSKSLSKAKIICGDGSDHNLLFEEDIEHMGACVSLTDMDEENILISMYVSSLKVPKVITKVNRNSFVSMLGSIGLESIISPKNTTANRIIRYVRAMQNVADINNVQTLYKIVNNQVEALEFRAGENTKFIGTPIKDLLLKKNVLIAGIIRKGELIIPTGHDSIEPMDSVIVVTTCQYLRDLNDIIK